MRSRSVRRALRTAVAIAVTCAVLATPATGRAQAATRAADRAAQRFDPIFRKYSKRYFGVGFDWRRFKAQAMAESNLDTAATSVVGARGLMQLMPSTFAAIQSARPEFANIDDPEWNVAAGIMHDRYLWKLWATKDDDDERARFMFGSYNAGEGPIKRANELVNAQNLTATWTHIERVAPDVPRWRYRETLGYVRRIEGNHGKLKGAPAR